MKLTDHQQAAYDSLHHFVTSDSGNDDLLAVLCGYAGTGKTTLIAQLVDELYVDHAIGVAAPTNKAVAVLQEKLGGAAVDFGSIHSYLGLRMKERDDGSQECQPEGMSKVHEYDLLIVDECSMINQDIFKRLVLSLRGKTKVIFVGDPAQLPPVGDKEESPVFRMISRKYMLSEVVRQAAENPIIALSMKLRDFIEVNKAAGPQDVQASIPADAVNACVAVGGDSTILSWSLHEIENKRDCRIVAFTNRRVLAFNQSIHEAIYGMDATVYCEGEVVIAHEQLEAKRCENGKPVTLHTNEELTVLKLEPEAHPKFADIPAYKLYMERFGGEKVWCYIPQDSEYFDARIAETWAKWREIKAEAEAMKQLGKPEYLTKDAEAKKTSSKAWAMKRAFGSIRHSYAITAHKSQGSTFDTAIIDYSDLAKMRSAFDFNRALYVAVTRPRDYLAVVF